MYLQVVAAKSSCSPGACSWGGGIEDAMAVPALLPQLGLGADEQRINYSSVKRQTSITTDVSPNV